MRRLVVRMRFHTDGLVGMIEIGSRDEENWRSCDVVVSAYGFSAEYTCSVCDEELRGFLAQLEAALSNLGQPARVSFRAMEDGFAFEIELDRRGHVEGKYEFRRDWPGPVLSGSFSADQTHLWAWVKELTAALER
jgi:hypothetical protein